MAGALDLNDIQTFAAVARAGTLSGAAAELRVPASTVSRALTRLETHLGLLLVRRSARGVVLTDAGRDYLNACKGALRSLKEGAELLENRRGNPAGLVRVACPITMARDVLSPLLGKFVDLYPELRIEIRPYTSGFDDEGKDDVDVFFKVKAPKDSAKRVRRYRSTVRGIFAGQGYAKRFGLPAEPGELRGHRCIGAGQWKLTRKSKAVSPEIAFQIYTSDPGVHRQLLLDGAGIALLPIWMARQPAVAKELVEVLPGWKPESIGLCALYSGNSRLTPKVKALLDFLEEYVGTARDPRLAGARAKDCFVAER